MIEIEQAALRAFEQHVLAGGDLARDVTAGVAGVRRELAARGHRVVDPLLRFGGGRARAAEVIDERPELVEVRGDELGEAIGLV